MSRGIARSSSASTGAGRGTPATASGLPPLGNPPEWSAAVSGERGDQFARRRPAYGGRSSRSGPRCRCPPRPRAAPASAASIPATAASPITENPADSCTAGPGGLPGLRRGQVQRTAVLGAEPVRRQAARAPPGRSYEGVSAGLAAGTRPSTAAATVVGGQDEPGRAGTGDDDVGTCQLDRHRRPSARRGPARPCADRLGPRISASRSARSGVRLATTISATPARARVAAASEDIEPGADHQGALARGPVRRPSRAAGELLEPEGDQRLPGPVDAGLGVGPLADPQRLLEQVVQQPARGVQLLRRARARP